MAAFYSPWDFLKDINTKKEHILRKDPDAEKDYPAFIINRILGGFLDTVLHVNQLNTRPFCDKAMQYDYLIHAVKKRNRFNKKIEVNKNLNIKTVMAYYGYSQERAHEVLPLFSEEQIFNMNKKLDKGGK